MQLELPAPPIPMLRQAGWLVCIGAPEPGLLESLDGGAQPLLLVLPSQDQAQQLLDGWGEEQWPAHWELQVQLVGAQSGECSWFRYNDPRCDGVVPLDQLRPRYPNLQLEGMELRPQLSLNALLQGWAPAAADGGVLLLAADPGELLPLLSTELAQRLQGVVQQGGAADVDPDLEARLRLASLVPESHASACVWRRDPMLHLERTLLAERDQLKQERDGLHTRVQDLEQRLAAINTELDSILALLDG